MNVSDNGNGNGSAGSPQSTPRSRRRHALGASPSVFYDDQPVGTTRSTVLAKSNNNNHIDRVEQKRRLDKAIEKFSKRHEKFREIIMHDILLYRERQEQPLIQL